MFRCPTALLSTAVDRSKVREKYHYYYTAEVLCCIDLIPILKCVEQLMTISIKLLLGQSTVRNLISAGTRFGRPILVYRQHPEAQLPFIPG